MRNKNFPQLQRDVQTLIYSVLIINPKYMYGIGVNSSAVDPPKRNENKVTIDLEGSMYERV